MKENPSESRAVLIGNSDGIGLAATRRLLAAGWRITGISRRVSPVTSDHYQHVVADVKSIEYSELLNGITMEKRYDLCIYFAGIGEHFNSADMRREAEIIEVNLTGMVKTASAVIPGMVRNREGHFIGISSIADELLSSHAPSYHASKAGFSNYMGGLALALKPERVHVTNVRFGFVDTKMAKGDFKPFMMSVEKSVDHLEYCMKKKPVRYTAPKIAIPMVKFRKLMMKLGAR